MGFLLDIFRVIPDLEYFRCFLGRMPNVVLVSKFKFKKVLR